MRTTMGNSPSPDIFVNSDAWNFWIFEHLEEMDRDVLVAAVKRDTDLSARDFVWLEVAVP